MESLNATEVFNRFKVFSKTFFVDTMPVNNEPIEQNSLIQTLKKRVEGNENEKCFFVVNMIGKNHEPEISYSFNTKELFNLAHFGLIDYFRMLPAFHLKVLLESSITIFQQLKGYNHEISATNHYQVYTPLKFFDGDTPKYLLAKRKLYPFQFTADNVLYSYINEISIENRFLTESDFLAYPLQPLILFNVDNLDTTFRNIIKQNLKLEHCLPFQAKQIEILKAYGSDEDLMPEKLILDLGIKLSTLYKHQTNVLGICKAELNLEFPTIKEAAKYFAKWWLI